MQQRLSLVTLGVADVAKSRRFYESLGWKASSGASQTGIAFFQAGSTVISLYGRAALAEDAHLSETGSGFGGITLAHNVRTREEVDAVIDHAVKAGGKLLKRAHDASWGGYSGYFADPDGHPWEVAWNPHMTILSDGSMQLPA